MRSFMIAAAATIAAFIATSFADPARAGPAFAGAAAPIQSAEAADRSAMTAVGWRRGDRDRDWGRRDRGWDWRDRHRSRRHYDHGWRRSRLVCSTRYGLSGPRRVCYYR